MEDSPKQHLQTSRQTDHRPKQRKEIFTTHRRKTRKKNNSTKRTTIHNEVRNPQLALMKGKNKETATSSNQPNNTPTSELQQKVSTEKTFTSTH
jgi:hypothetical protein